MDQPDWMADTLLSMGYQWDQVMDAINHVTATGSSDVQDAIDFLSTRSTGTGSPSMSQDEQQQQLKDNKGKDGGGDADAVVPTVPQAKVRGGTESEYKETRLQVRLPSGKSIARKFPVNETLNSVREFVLNNPQEEVREPFGLEIPFPRSQFSPDDFTKTLQDLGLVPSCVLIVTKHLEQDWFKSSTTDVHYKDGTNCAKLRKKELEESKRQEEVRKNQEEVKRKLKEEEQHKERVKKLIQHDQIERKHKFNYGDGQPNN